ncbi:FAD/NAD(P)-binding domain-containing protein [Meredithblackwellia eburnea MCA 4105]
MSPAPEELKNVVVIGLGFAGVEAAKLLAAKLPPTHRVIAISDLSFAYNPIASLRAAVVPGWEDKITCPLDHIFPSGSRHLLLTDHRAVKLEANRVILEPSREIEFEYAVVASGSIYEFPCRAPNGSSSLSACRESLKALQEDIKSSNAILVCGGGPAGVEAAGELAEAHPDKKIHLVHSRAKLFDDCPVSKLSPSITSQLEDLGVEIHYKSRLNLKGRRTGKIEEENFELGDGKVVKADFLFVTFGCKPNSDLLSTLPGIKLTETNHVLVKPTIQVQTDEDFSYPHIFAPGDVNSIPENKLAGCAVRHTWAAAANILSLITGQAKALKTYKASGPRGSITVGSNGGAGYAFGWYFPRWLVARTQSRDLHTGHFYKIYNEKL